MAVLCVRLASSRWLRRVAPLGLACLAALGGGCVSQGEHDRLKFALGRCEQDREQMLDQLNSERARANGLQGKLDDAEGRLKSQQDVLASLQGENSRLGDEVKRLQALIEKLSNMPVPTMEPVEKVVYLPAELDAALKKFAEANPELVEYDSRTGVVRFKSDLTFALGSYEVKAQAQEVLKQLASIINGPEAASFQVMVVGHTDTVPIRGLKNVTPTNWHLSSYRAISVLAAMIEGGLAPERCGVVGYGPMRPIMENTPTGAEKNRRVEIFLVPSTLFTTTST